MLKEIITFVDMYNKESPTQHKEPRSGKQIIIIKTKENKNDDSLMYNGLEILDDDSKVNGWIDKNKHYEKIIDSFRDYVLPGEPNKALGSTSGLITFTFFAFKLSQKNLDDLKKKISKTKFLKKNHSILIENIHEILNDALPDLTKNKDNTFNYLDFHVLIHTDEKRFIKWDKIASEFITERTSIGKKTSVVKGECFVCRKSNLEISNPSFLTNYDGKKFFLKHITRVSQGGIPLRVCRSCSVSLNQFLKILDEQKIKIFPLFVESDKVNGEIKLLNHKLERDENRFNFIFNQLYKRDRNVFDFYLVIISKEYLFFDYVSGYTWEIGCFTDYFRNDKKPKPIKRYELEGKLAEALHGKKSFIKYFGPIKGKDNQETTLIYSLRQKIFDFVYRNKKTLTFKDLQNIILFRIEKSIRNKEKPDKETFNLFFNRHLLLSNESKPKCILDDVKSIKDKILSDNNEKIEIDSDERWAYFAGQIAYYLISLSKSKKLTYGLLEPFTNKSTTKLVKKTIEQLIAQYKHEIKLDNKRFKKITTCVFSYEPSMSFTELKIPFYVGALDDNVI